MGYGKEINRLRTAAKISIQKIAERIGVDPEKWSKWEQRDSTPKEEDIHKIETYFDKTLDQLIKLQRFPIVRKSPFGLEEEHSKYHTKDELIDSLQETVQTQKMLIAYLQKEVDMLMKERELKTEGAESSNYEKPVSKKTTVVKT